MTDHGRGNVMGDLNLDHGPWTMDYLVATAAPVTHMADVIKAEVIPSHRKVEAGAG
jgi:hypothetical protein